MAHVLVTGGAGFIGNNVVRVLVANGHDVTVADNFSKGTPENLKGLKGVKLKKADLCNASEVRGLLSDMEYCIHLAAKIGGIGYFHKYPAEIIRDNALMHTHLLDEALKAKGFRKMIYVSSSMVFERATHFPSKEEDIFTCPPPITHYGFSKLMGEFYSTAYKEQYGLPYTIFRPFNAYGPGEVPEDEVGIAHVIPDLIKKVAFDRQYPVEILGKGDQVRAYTYVTDIAEAIGTLSLDKRTDNNDFNVANPATFTVMEILERVWNMCGPNGKGLEVKHLPAFKDDVLRRVPSAEKIYGLGWRPKVELDEGLKNTYNWILAKRGS